MTLAETSTVLARQRRDYGIDEELFPPQYPVMQQAANIDDTPVNNIACERTCGKVDCRLKKLGDLEASFYKTPRRRETTGPLTSEATKRILPR